MTRDRKAAGHFSATRYTDRIVLLRIMNTPKPDKLRATIATAEAAERKFKTASGRAKQLKEKSREAKRLQKQAKKAAKRAAKDARAARKVAENARREYKKAAMRAAKARDKATKAAKSNATITTPRKPASNGRVTPPSAGGRKRRRRRTRRRVWEVGEDATNADRAESTVLDSGLTVLGA